MGETVKRFTLVSLMICVLVFQTFSSVSARSVHSVSDFDLFPQGDLTNPEDWQTD